MPKQRQMNRANLQASGESHTMKTTFTGAEAFHQRKTFHQKEETTVHTAKLPTA